MVNFASRLYASLTASLASTLPFKCSAKQAHVGRAQERRNIQRTSRQLRQFHEHHPTRGIPDQFGRRPFLEAQRMLYSREHDKISPRARYPARCRQRGTEPRAGCGTGGSRRVCERREPRTGRAITSARRTGRTDAWGQRSRSRSLVVCTSVVIMFYIIGLGLCDEKDITVRGLEAVKGASRVYLEAYTSILMVQKDRLEAFYGKQLILADRDMVETMSDDILRQADEVDVALLVVGDPFGATTHTDIILRARALGIPMRVIHNASIMNAIGAAGLQLYQFGQTVSLVFFTETWKPDSFYDRVKENVDVGLHTLVLLDIKVKEQSDENLIRGRKIYEPPRYMSIPLAVRQLVDTECVRKAGILEPETTLAIALSRVGGGDEQRIVAGTLGDLLGAPEDAFGEPLHSLIIVGKRLHHLEVEYAEAFAVDRQRWRNVASTVYGCALDS